MRDIKKAKRLREPEYKELEKYLDMWFRDTKAHNSITLDGPLIQAQALKIATMLQKPDFKASSGWLNSFLKRHNISYKKCIGEAGLVDKVAAEKYQHTLIELIKDYSPDDIFNADETALMYRATPTHTYEYKDTPADNIKIQKERLSILFCANMSGDKMKPIVFGQFKNPRNFN